MEDKHAKLRQFATELTGELEVGIQQLMRANSLDDLVNKAGGKIVIASSSDEFQKRMDEERSSGAYAVRGARWGVNEWIAIYGNGDVWIDANQARLLDAQIKALKMTLTSQGAGIGPKPKRSK